jgi:hypothetical protein
MNYPASLTAGTAPAAIAAKQPALPRRRVHPVAVAVAATVAMLLCWAWNVNQSELYVSGKGFGYFLGLTGGSMMLILLLYPLRKRARFMHDLGPLKYWFRFHMVAGVLGPVLVLFHSTFRVGSLNAGVALSCMLLVVASGLAGRFLYRKIHHGLYGTHATLQEMQQILARDLELIAPALQRLPEVKREFDSYAALIAHRPSGWYERGAHFLSLGWRRMLAARRVRAALAERAASERPDASLADLATLLQTLDATLQAGQRAAQFTTYERLFALWHVIHIPFLIMLAITAVVHVVAVHAY